MPFMAITAHYIIDLSDGGAQLRSRLVGFQSVFEDHSGVNLARVFFDFLKEYNLLHRVRSSLHCYLALLISILDWCYYTR